MKPSTIFTDDVIETADSVECTPEGDMFCCATYQLVKHENASDQRIGSIRLYQLAAEDDPNETGKLVAAANSSPACELKQTITCNGVLDIKWFDCRRGQQNNDRSCYENNMLVAADSSGNATFYELNRDSTELRERSCVAVDSDALSLSTDWFPCGDRAVVSLSSGDVAVVDVAEAVVVKKWRAHDFETWIAAVDCWDGNRVYSGGDDCRWKMWDTRVDGPVATSRYFDMGVCSVQSHPLREHLVSVGSYDERVVVWDHRNIRIPISETRTGGGVWRIKWHPKSANILLAACMHAGFKIFEFTDAYDQPEVVCTYEEHESLAYGSDWCVSGNQHSDGTDWWRDSFVATCSFYDHALKVWNVHD